MGDRHNNIHVLVQDVSKSISLDRDLTPPLYKGRLGGVKIHAVIQADSHGKTLELLRSPLPHPSPPLGKGRGQDYAPTASLAAYITSRVIIS